MTVHEGVGWSRDEMAERAAMDIPDGAYVNLGIGIPELVATHVPEGREFIYHTENGLLGMGPSPEPGGGEPELINAGKKRVTAVPGAAYFHHADSFAMIRSPTTGTLRTGRPAGRMRSRRWAAPWTSSPASRRCS